MHRLVIALACCFIASTVAAGEPHLLTTPSGLTIAPFAIPVAVPVAVVDRPTLFYGYGQYAPPPATHTAAAGAASEEPVSLDVGGETDPLRAQAAALFKRRCAECHQGPTAQGGFTLFDADARLIARLPRQRIAELCTEEVAPRMPPAERPRLTPQEQALVRRWAVPPRDLRY